MDSTAGSSVSNASSTTPDLDQYHQRRISYSQSATPSEEPEPERREGIDSAVSVKFEVDEELGLEDKDGVVDEDDKIDKTNISSLPSGQRRKKRKSWGQELPTPKTNLPPRKRAKTEDEKEQRRIERVLRNRAAAQSSRERKRQEVERLEGEKAEIESQNQFLKDRLMAVEHEKFLLSQQFARALADLKMVAGDTYQFDHSDHTSDMTRSMILPLSPLPSNASMISESPCVLSNRSQAKKAIALQNESSDLSCALAYPSPSELALSPYSTTAKSVDSSYHDLHNDSKSLTLHADSLDFTLFDQSALTTSTPLESIDLLKSPLDSAIPKSSPSLSGDLPDLTQHPAEMLCVDLQCQSVREEPDRAVLVDRNKERSKTSRPDKPTRSSTKMTVTAHRTTFKTQSSLMAVLPKKTISKRHPTPSTLTKTTSLSSPIPRIWHSTTEKAILKSSSQIMAFPLTMLWLMSYFILHHLHLYRQARSVFSHLQTHQTSRITRVTPPLPLILSIV